MYYLVAADATVDLSTCKVHLFGINGTCAPTTVYCYDSSHLGCGTPAASVFTQGEDGFYFTGQGLANVDAGGIPSDDGSTTTYPTISIANKQALINSGVCNEGEDFDWGLFLLILAIITALGFGIKWFLDQRKK